MSVSREKESIGLHPSSYLHEGVMPSFFFIEPPLFFQCFPGLRPEPLLPSADGRYKGNLVSFCKVQVRLCMTAVDEDQNDLAFRDPELLHNLQNGSVLVNLQSLLSGAAPAQRGEKPYGDAHALRCVQPHPPIVPALLREEGCTDRPSRAAPLIPSKNRSGSAAKNNSSSPEGT